MSLVKFRNGASGYYPSNTNDLFERFFNDSLFDNTRDVKFSPKADILESDSAYEIHLAVPGFAKESFTLDIDDKVLAVSGERKFEEEKTEKTYKSVQTNYGSFKRSFTLPDNINIKKIDAKYNNGMLEIVLPKDETKVIKTTITVK